VDGVDGVDGVNVDGVGGVDGVDGSVSHSTIQAKNSPNPTRVSERYFILKSFSLRDLKRSVQNGIWATQPHNEAALNDAYEVSATSKSLCLTFHH
jgi:hypothetical protein